MKHIMRLSGENPHHTFFFLIFLKGAYKMSNKTWNEILKGLGIGFMVGSALCIGYEIGHVIGVDAGEKILSAKAMAAIDKGINNISSDACKAIDGFKALGAEKLNANDFCSVTFDAFKIDPSPYLVDGNFVFDLADMYKLWGSV